MGGNHLSAIWDNRPSASIFHRESITIVIVIEIETEIIGINCIDVLSLTNQYLVLFSIIGFHADDNIISEKMDDVITDIDGFLNGLTT